MNKLLTFLAGSLLTLNVYGWEIVLPDNPTPVEKQAAAELKHYIEKSVKGKLLLDGQDDFNIFVGDSEFARKNGIVQTELAEEEWLIRSDKNNVAILGGGKRGTIYAAYHFLEDHLGVRWWTPQEEFVPTYENFEIGTLDLRGKPFFKMRDIYRSWNNSKEESGIFAAHRRLNRDGDMQILPQYGGSIAYGPPNFVHTFNFYFPEDKYFKEHPEYFALIKGERKAGVNSQLCLSNLQMREEMFERLKYFIAQAEQKAQADNVEPPLIYDISGNDGFNPCECENCQAIVRREEAESGVLIDCLNEIAAKLKTYRPNYFINTLAYCHTEKPPKHIRPLDNIIIRLCDTSTNVAAPFYAPENHKFVEMLKAWSQITPNLAIWDYSITYMVPSGPYPYEYTLIENIRTYANNKVNFMFFEHECPDSADMHALNTWLETKLLEDPYANGNKLIAEFTSQYYGNAGAKIAQYRQLIRDRYNDGRTFIDWFAIPGVFSHIGAKTAIEAQQILTEAEQAVANDPTYLRRVQRVRQNLDRICALNWKNLVNDYVNWGYDAKDFPLDQKQIIQRGNQNWLKSIDFVIAEPLQKSCQANAAKELAEVSNISYTPVEPPEGFAVGNYLDFPVDTAQIYCGAKISNDSSARTQKVVTIESDNLLPLPFTLVAPSQENPAAKGEITAQDVRQAGYNLYKVAEITPFAGAFIKILNDGAIQFRLDQVLDKTPQPQKYEVYISAKFDGPQFEFGDKTKPNSVSIERMILKKID